VGGEVADRTRDSLLIPHAALEGVIALEDGADVFADRLQKVHGWVDHSAGWDGRELKTTSGPFGYAALCSGFQSYEGGRSEMFEFVECPLIA